jgi:hypothetical protein
MPVVRKGRAAGISNRAILGGDVHGAQNRALDQRAKRIVATGFVRFENGSRRRL